MMVKYQVKKQQAKRTKLVNMEMSQNLFYPYLLYAYKQHIKQVNTNLMANMSNHFMCNRSDVLLFNLSTMLLDLNNRDDIMSHVSIRYRTLPKLRNMDVTKQSFQIVNRMEYQEMFTLNIEAYQHLQAIDAIADTPFYFQQKERYYSAIEILRFGLENCYANLDDVIATVQTKTLYVSDDFTLYYKALDAIGRNAVVVSETLTEYMRRKLDTHLAESFAKYKFSRFSIKGDSLLHIFDYKDDVMAELA